MNPSNLPPKLTNSEGSGDIVVGDGVYCGESGGELIALQVAMYVPETVSNERGVGGVHQAEDPFETIVATEAVACVDEKR